MSSPDPFDALAAGTAAIEPSTAFRSELRNRLAIELELTEEIAAVHTPARLTGASTPSVAPSRVQSNTQEITMTDQDDATETEMANDALVPYLCCSGAAEAMAFYIDVFGAIETMRMVSDDGRVGHAELRVGAAKFFLADEYPEIGVLSPTTLGGSSVNLQLRVGDVDAVYRSALGHGATGMRPPSDQFYGERTATITDPYGHRWTFTAPIETVSNEVMAQRSAAQGFTSSFGEASGVAPDTARADGPDVVEVGYYTIGVVDVDKAAAFYGALFGWAAEEAAVGSVGGLYRHVANTKLPLGFTDNETSGRPRLHYRVDDVAAAAERVRQLGGTVVSIDDYASGGSASCLDDQGNAFDLWEPGPGY